VAGHAMHVAASMSPSECATAITKWRAKIQNGGVGYPLPIDFTRIITSLRKALDDNAWFRQSAIAKKN